MDREMIEIENEILDKLAGKIYLMQAEDKKRKTIFDIFLEVYNTARCRKFIARRKGLEMEKFFNEFLSFDLIDEFLNDPEVEDIMINSLGPIYIHKTARGLIKTEKSFQTKEELDLFIKKLVIFSGRHSVKKINNIELSEIKGRANIATSPFGPQVTITRAKEKPLSIIDLIANNTLSPAIAAQLWLYVEGLSIKPANVIISGGPGSGKTTLLNALFSFIPSHDRLVVIEDTLELNSNYEENCARLESDEDMNLADLVKNSLRMRPDRIIVGEVRGHEARDMMTAMNIGKYCMGTLHASTARETVMRIENEPMNVPKVLLNLIDVIIIMRRFQVKGEVYRVVAEIVETAGVEKDKILLSNLWSFDPSNRQFKDSMVSSIYRDELAEISGKTPREILNEITLRSHILKAMQDKGINDIQDVSRICRLYAFNPQRVIKDLGLNPDNLFKR